MVHSWKIEKERIQFVILSIEGQSTGGQSEYFIEIIILVIQSLIRRRRRRQKNYALAAVVAHTHTQRVQICFSLLKMRRKKCISDYLSNFQLL